ncbi:MAG TPA: ATP-binding protein [Candidatus Baltobacteraceae bacterium]|nr:ATP-binding protein [Candidatus Baltobacteraceae bacterium]
MPVSWEAFNLLSNLRLRTKLLLSLALVTVALSCATLFAVRSAGEAHARQELVSSTHTSLMTFDVLFRQKQNALARKADLLATQAAMAGTQDDDDQKRPPAAGSAAAPDPDGLQAAGDPLESDGSDLVAVADTPDEIVVLHSKEASFPAADALRMLHRSLANHATADWWYVGGSLYQVALERIGGGPGTVIVGREIDYRAVHDMGRISDSGVVFTYDRNVVASTFRPIEEEETGQALSGAPAPATIRIGDEKFFADSLQLNGGSGPVARLTVLKSYSGETAFLAELNHLLLALGFVAVLGGAGLAFVISDTFTRPLYELLRGFRALERGDYEYPLDAHGGDEVAHATRAFDRMRKSLRENDAQRRQLEDQLRQSQKMEALGRLAGGVAHDFNNLLTVIKGHSELIVDRMTAADPVLSSGQQIRKAADRAASLTRQMLAFSRKQALQPKVLNINVLVDDMSKLLKRLMPADIEVEFRADPSLGNVKADAGQLEQVLMNLTVNARDAMPRGGKITIETENAALTPEFARTHPPMELGDYVRLAVIDTGTGMDAATKAHIFEPFFTTKEAGKGTGLGLSTVYGVVKQTGGFIWVDSEPGLGSKFEVYLPRVSDAVEPGTIGRAMPACNASQQTVLLVEDEPAVREVACAFLTSANYRVLAAEDGEQAMQIAAREAAIDVLITDMMMPRMRGSELARELLRWKPGVKVIYMSGYLEPAEPDGDAPKDAFFLQKPFSREALVDQVAEALRLPSPASPAAATRR